MSILNCINHVIMGFFLRRETACNPHTLVSSKVDFFRLLVAQMHTEVLKCETQYGTTQYLSQASSTLERSMGLIKGQLTLESRSKKHEVQNALNGPNFWTEILIGFLK